MYKQHHQTLLLNWDWQGECVDIVRSNPTLTVNSNIRGVELTFNTSKDWNYNVI